MRMDILGASSGVVQVAIAGELDLSNAHIMRVRLLAAVRDRHPVVLDLDLAGVTFIDSTAVHALQRIHTTAERSGCRMRVLRPQPAVVRILEVLGVLDLFTTGSPARRTTEGASAL